MPQEMLDAAVRLLRAAPAISLSPDKLPELGAGNFVYLFLGAPERAIKADEELARAGYFYFTLQYWYPDQFGSALRKTDKFKVLVRESGMLKYWRARGWPDLCHPTTGDDFECS
jgi:hypothetical protein